MVGSSFRHPDNTDTVADLVMVLDILFGVGILPEAIPKMVDSTVQGNLLLDDIV
jgi:hypothetical protein